MTCISGFVTPVPTGARDAYEEHARAAWPMMRRLGALRMVECWGEDVRPGEHTDYPRAVDATGDETVVFSWIEWPDRATADAAAEGMADDPDFHHIVAAAPFDSRRMLHGGFTPILDLTRRSPHEGEPP